jgi:hypothetical protein
MYYYSYYVFLTINLKQIKKLYSYYNKIIMIIIVTVIIKYY